MTKIKICGITNLADAEVAVEAGADLLGFIFYKPSPRYVAPDTVAEIVSRLKPHSDVRYVGVFVNSPRDTVTDILDGCGLDAVQLHGEEPPEIVAYFEGRAYKALRPQSMAEAETLVSRYMPCHPTSEAVGLPCLLLDAYHPKLYGGTGRVTDWTMARTFAQKHAVMLAGSLTAENVAEAIAAVQPWGVDVSSGVEASKGKKNHDQVRAFIKAARAL